MIERGPYRPIWSGDAQLPQPTPEQQAIEDQQRREARWNKSRVRFLDWLEDQSGIPGRLHQIALETARSTPAIEAIRAYLGDDEDDAPWMMGQCLVLAGPTGVGKTYAAAAAMISRTWGRLWYFGALAGALLDPMRRVAALASCKSEDDFLVLDDLGTEYVKDGGLMQSFLDEIIWHREGNALATIITTNLPADQLAQRLGDRIADRLRGEWGRIVECPGASLR